MKSMTGFGKAERKTPDYDLTVEIKAVNHRFLDVTFKMPKTFSYLEDALKKTVQSRILRGHLDVYVSFLDKKSGEVLSLNESTCAEYIRINNLLREKYGLTDDMTTTSLMRLPDALIAEQAEAEDMTEAVKDAALEALSALDEMRSAEGEALKVDLMKKAEAISSLLDQVEERAPVVVEEYRAKLKERIETAVKAVQIDESKLIQEVAFFCDKANIDEELTRLRTHMKAFANIIEETPSGRKLDFLVQEINRECNTIGSKSNDAYLTDKVVKLKTEVEKIREQVQNVE